MAEEQVAWAHPPQLEANPPETTALPKLNGDAHNQQDAHHQLPDASQEPQSDLAYHQYQHSLSSTDMATMQHHHQLLLAQAQGHLFESDQQKAGSLPMTGAEQLGLLQHPHPQDVHMPHHDAEFDRDRKEKRKLANREAARRMRQRRAEQLTTLSSDKSDLQKEIVSLQQQLNHLASHNRELMAENQTLKQDLMLIKQALTVDRRVQDTRLSETVAEPTAPEY